MRPPVYHSFAGCRIFLALAAVSLAFVSAHAAVPESVRGEAEKAGFASGLAVIVGSTDGAAEVALAEGGRWLVQGLARDEKAVLAARATIRGKGLYGIATVVGAQNFKTLPFADGLATLVVVDRGALGNDAPPEAEVLRILAPGGLALSWSGERWSHAIAPRSPDLDDWTHFDHDATGSGQSLDKRVAPPTQLQWRVEVQPYRGWGGNPAGYRPYSTFRIAGGRSFCIENQMDAKTQVESKTENAVLQARHASNGLPIWKWPLNTRAASATHIEYQLVADAERVVFVPAPGKPPLALDAATGKELFSYDIPLPDTPTGKIGPAIYLQLRLDQGRLVVCLRESLYCCDAATGKRLWTYKPEGGWPCFPRILPDGRVLVQLVEGLDRVAMRWPNMPTLAVACLNLSDGKEQFRVALPLQESLAWREDLKRKKHDKDERNPQATGPLRLGQGMVAGDLLYLFGASGIGAQEGPGQLACIDLKERKLRWASFTGTWGYNLVLRDATPFWFTPSTLFTAVPESGEVKTAWRAPFNNRCNRSAASPNWIINGMGIWYDTQGSAIVRSVGRSGCAQGPTLAQGMVFYTPNTCACITQIRGHVAFSAEAVRPAPTEVERRSTTGGDNGTLGKPTIDTTPISSEWALEVFSGAKETAPLVDGARTYVAVINEHRLECREGERTVWNFTAGGRICQPPVLGNGGVYFGSHDGYAYCLDAATGALRWRFLGGGAERRIVSHGQVESSWPVYNVVLHDGAASFTAGLHPETGGGIFAWGLDPATGAVKWKHHFVRSEVKIGQNNAPIAPNRVLNSPLSVVDGKLSIVGLNFSPADDPKAIQTLIDTGSLKDQLRNEGPWTLRGEMPGKR
jgi:outer membrane protein assembly factor BamB